MVPGDKRTHRNAPVDGFTPVGHRPAGHQVGHGSADLLCVDAQIMLLHQVKANGVGDAPESQLDTVPVPHQVGDIAGNGLLPLPDGRVLELEDGLIHLIHHIRHRDRQGTLPPDHRGPGIDLKNNLVRPVDVLQGHNQVAAQVDIAVPVHGGDLGHKDVGGQAPPDLLPIVVLVHREIGVQPAPPGGHGPPVKEKGMVAKAPRQRRVPGHRVVVPADGVPAVNPLLQPGGDGVQVFQEHLGLTAVGGPGQAVPVVDPVQGILDRAQALSVEGPGRLAPIRAPEIGLLPLVHGPFPSSTGSMTFM